MKMKKKVKDVNERCDRRGGEEEVKRMKKR